MITYINPRAEHDLRGSDLYFYHMANDRHDSVKRERQNRADHISRTCSRLLTAAIVFGVLGLLARLGV